MLVAKCQGPGCESTDLIEAHIIPRCFAVYIGGNDPNGGNVQLTQQGSANAWPALGEYDKGFCAPRATNASASSMDISTMFVGDLDATPFAWAATMRWRASTATGLHGSSGR